MDTYHAQLQSAEFASSMMKLGCYLFMAVGGVIRFFDICKTKNKYIKIKKKEKKGFQGGGV